MFTGFSWDTFKDNLWVIIVSLLWFIKIVCHFNSGWYLSADSLFNHFGQVKKTIDYQTGEEPSILTIFGVLFNGVTGIMGKNITLKLLAITNRKLDQEH